MKCNSEAYNGVTRCYLVRFQDARFVQVMPRELMPQERFELLGE